jgi:hypothetical protein
MFKFDKDAQRKVINQKVTPANPEHSGFTTAITTEKQMYTSTKKSLNPDTFVDVIKFSEEDYYDPSLWPELQKYIPEYSKLEYDSV